MWTQNSTEMPIAMTMFTTETAFRFTYQGHQRNVQSIVDEISHIPKIHHSHKIDLNHRHNDDDDDREDGVTEGQKSHNKDRDHRKASREPRDIGDVEILLEEDVENGIWEHFETSIGADLVREIIRRAKGDDEVFLSVQHRVDSSEPRIHKIRL